MPLAIDVVREAFRQLAAGGADNVPRVRARAPGVVLHSLECRRPIIWASSAGRSTRPRVSGAQFLVGLHDAATGRCEALIEADRLGQLRTGATTGVAVEWLALPRASEVGVFGSGRQARTQLEAVASVRPLSDGLCLQPLGREPAEICRRDVGPAANRSPAGRPSARSGRRIADRRHGHQQRHAGLRRPVPGRRSAWSARSAAIGPRGPKSIRTSSAGPTTSFATASKPAGSKRAISSSRWKAASSIGIGAVDLADVVAGTAIGRSTKDSIVLFKSVGLAIEDVALAAKLLELARANGKGQPLPF